MSEPSPERQNPFEEALRNMDLPESPVSDIDAAILAWETVFQKFSAREFTNSQALYFTACLLLGSPGQPPNR